MTLETYIRSLTGHVFKILPLKEAVDRGEPVQVAEYIQSLVCDAAGAMRIFPELNDSVEYGAVLNVLSFLSTEPFDHKTCKREVFKMLRVLNRIAKDGGDHE